MVVGDVIRKLKTTSVLNLSRNSFHEKLPRSEVKYTPSWHRSIHVWTAYSKEQKRGVECRVNDL
jgi:hypothetical protein